MILISKIQGRRNVPSAKVRDARGTKRKHRDGRLVSILYQIFLSHYVPGPNTYVWFYHQHDIPTEIIKIVSEPRFCLELNSTLNVIVEISSVIQSGFRCCNPLYWYWNEKKKQHRKTSQNGCCLTNELFMQIFVIGMYLSSLFFHFFGLLLLIVWIMRHHTELLWEFLLSDICLYLLWFVTFRT